MGEFNIWFDSEAAHHVFSSTKNITVLPLDVTNTLQVQHSDMKRITKKFDSTLAQGLYTISKELTKSSLEFRDTDTHGYKVHDGSTMMYLLYPELFSFRRGKTMVEWDPKSVCYGKTLNDTRNFKENLFGTNSWVAAKVDSEKAVFLFLREIFDILSLDLQEKEAKIGHSVSKEDLMPDDEL
eukprot:TRINITY_DN3334_c0_g1_i2.p2 TRINITY_DN3334_c0_g1~~TRINITY_DN3334_c0_g1_i2.p2  ORF type:complete len:182 (+),score=61.71 TRINITY_DN3334_c0_g1_i2:842-1387(+)